MEELLEVEAPEAAGSGLAVARDRRGLYIAKAPRALRLRAGDRLVGARIFFEGAPPEVVARLLEGAAGCRVSLCVRRRAPGTGSGPAGHGGTGTGPPIPIPTPPKKPPAAPAVELALPKLPKLGKSRGEAEPLPPPPPAPVPARPRAAPPRLTVKEAAGGRAMQEPPLKAEPPGIARLPAVEVAAPRVTVGLSLPGGAPEPALPLPEPHSKAGDGAAFGGIRVPSVSIAELLLPKAEPPPPPPPVAPARLGLLEAVPSLGIAVPRVEVALALPSGAEGLRKLSAEAEPGPPGAVGAAKHRGPRFALPRVALALGKLGTGAADGTGGAGAKLKAPKLSLAPFGAAAPVPPLGRRRSPSLPKLPTGPEVGVKLPRFGGSSPELRSGGDPKALPGSPGAMRALPAQGPRFAVPAVGFSVAEDAKGTGAAPVLPPPGSDAEQGPGRWAGLKLPRFGAGGGGGGRMRMEGGRKSIPPPAASKERGDAEGKGRRRRWVPRVGFSPPTPPSTQHKGGRLRIPDVELCPPGHPQPHGGTPKLPLLSPPLCGEW